MLLGWEYLSIFYFTLSAIRSLVNRAPTLFAAWGNYKESLTTVFIGIPILFIIIIIIFIILAYTGLLLFCEIILYSCSSCRAVWKASICAFILSANSRNWFIDTAAGAAAVVTGVLISIMMPAPLRSRYFYHLQCHLGTFSILWNYLFYVSLPFMPLASMTGFHAYHSLLQLHDPVFPILYTQIIMPYCMIPRAAWCY